MQEQIIQLLENEDEANVLIGLEMIKGWGYSHTLLNHLVTVYLFSSNPHLRQSILAIMEQYAPTEIAQLYMENWMVFGNSIDWYYDQDFISDPDKHLLNILKDVVQLECIDQVKFVNLILNYSALNIFEVSKKLGIGLHHLEKTAQLEFINDRNDELPALLDALGSFTNLIRLDLPSAKLEQLPKGIGKLKKLRYAYFQNNHLKTLPKELFECTNLVNLDLSNNQLQSIPAEIQQLTKLETLVLNHNKLQSLPEEIGMLPNLRVLELDQNRLETIPITLGQAHKLKNLHIRSNQLKQLPTSICQLNSLVELDLEDNAIEKLEMEVNCWKNLKILLLRNNNLRNWAIPHLAMPKLEWLDLTFNQIHYIQPFEWIHLHELENLWCEHNFISSRELATLKQVLPKAYLIPNPPPQKPLIINPQRLL